MCETVMRFALKIFKKIYTDTFTYSFYSHSGKINKERKNDGEEGIEGNHMIKGKSW